MYMYMSCSLSINNLQLGLNVVFQSTHVFPLVIVLTSGQRAGSAERRPLEERIKTFRCDVISTIHQSLLPVVK